MWGDQDHVAPQPALDAYRAVPQRLPNVEVHIFPGIQHGYTMPSAKAFDAPGRAFSMARALSILEGLRDAPGKPLRHASLQQASQHQRVHARLPPSRSRASADSQPAVAREASGGGSTRYGLGDASSAAQPVDPADSEIVAGGRRRQPRRALSRFRLPAGSVTPRAPASGTTFDRNRRGRSHRADTGSILNLPLQGPTNCRNRGAMHMESSHAERYLQRAKLRPPELATRDCL